MGGPAEHRVLFWIRNQREHPLNILIGVAVPLRRFLQLLAVENIPILILVVVGVLPLRRTDSNNEPTAAERGLAIMVLVRLPRQMWESIDQCGEQDQPLVIEGVEGMKTVAYLSDVTQLFQRDVIFLTELFQFHGFFSF